MEVSKMGLPPEEAIERIYPEFQQMLDSPDWLSDEFKVPLPEKFAQYLVHREEDNSLSVMAMVVPAGCTTPVHDHLAWGLVGVYQGSQLETVYHREDDGSDPDRARLTHVAPTSCVSGTSPGSSLPTATSTRSRQWIRTSLPSRYTSWATT